MPKYYAVHDPQLGYACLEVPDGKELPAEYADATPLDLHFEAGLWSEAPGLERVTFSMGVGPWGEVMGSTWRPIPLALALSRVAIGRTVFVRREDAGAVLVAANGVGVGGGETA